MVLSTSGEDFILVIALFFFYVYFIFERERQSVSGGEVEREGDKESEAGSRLSHPHRARYGAQSQELQDHDLS